MININIIRKFSESDADIEVDLKERRLNKSGIYLRILSPSIQTRINKYNNYYIIRDPIHPPYNHEYVS